MSRLIVSLAALGRNYSKFVEAASGQVGAVVKADAYGLGATQVSAYLQGLGCQHFFVATAHEGTSLRETTKLPIYVFEGATLENVDLLVRHELTPVLNSLAQCTRWASTTLPAALHVDTGMNRLGLPLEEVGSINERLDLRWLITHLARADERDHAFTQQQCTRVHNVASQLRLRYPKMRVSIANSAGILAGVGPEDLGRAGIGLYGGNPFGTTADNPMEPVATLLGEILQVRTVSAGQPVGYGGTYTTTQQTYLGVVSLGYADGVPRALSNVGSAWVRDRSCPIVGRVSMDTLVIDLGASGVGEGDEVELFGQYVALEQVAAQAQTLSYEVLTGVGQRVQRSYLAS